MLKAREENIEGCGEIQKQKDRNFVVNEENDEIIEYAERNSLRAVPGPISRLVDAAQIEC